MPRIQGKQARRGTAGRKKKSKATSEWNVREEPVEEEEKVESKPSDEQQQQQQQQPSLMPNPTAAEVPRSPSILKSKEVNHVAESGTKRVRFDTPEVVRKRRKKPKSPRIAIWEEPNETGFGDMEFNISRMMEQTKQRQSQINENSITIPITPTPVKLNKVSDVEYVPLGSLPPETGFSRWISVDPHSMGAEGKGKEGAAESLAQNLGVFLEKLPELAEMFLSVSAQKSAPPSDNTPSDAAADADVSLEDAPDAEEPSPLPYPKRLDLSSPLRPSKAIGVVSTEKDASEMISSTEICPVAPKDDEAFSKQSAATKALEDRCARQEALVKRMEANVSVAELSEAEKEENAALKSKLTEAEAEIKSLGETVASQEEENELLKEKLAEKDIDSKAKLEATTKELEDLKKKYKAKEKSYEKALETKKHQLDKAKKLDEKRRAHMKSVDDILAGVQKEVDEKVKAAKAAVAKAEAKNRAYEEEIVQLKKKLQIPLSTLPSVSSDGPNFQAVNNDGGQNLKAVSTGGQN